MEAESLEQIPGSACRLELNDRGAVVWPATVDGSEVIETREPQTTWAQRFIAWLLKLAPEQQL